MKLYSDWKLILRKAWSMRLIAIGALLTGCEGVINIIGVDFLPVPKGWRILIVLVVMALAAWSRLVRQPKTLGDN